MFHDPRRGDLPASIRSILRTSVGLDQPVQEVRAGEVGLLEHHGVIELALEAADSGSISLDEVVEMRLVHANERLQHRSSAVEARAVWACAELESASLDVRVLKGVAVASLDHHYREVRVFKDVDLLVPPDLLGHAVSVLEGAGAERSIAEPFAGYDRRFSKGAAMVCGDGMEIDLHRTFSLGAYGQRIDLAELWRTSQHFDLGGRRLAALEPEARALHTLVHIGLTPQVKAIEMLDLRRLLERQDFDKDELLSKAGRWGVEPPAAVAVALAAAWLGPDWLPSTLADWARDRRLSRVDEWLIGGYVGRRASSPRRTAGLLAGLGWADRSRYGIGYARRLARRVR